MRKKPKLFGGFLERWLFGAKTEILFQRKPGHEAKWSNDAAYILCERAADDVLL